MVHLMPVTSEKSHSSCAVAVSEGGTRHFHPGEAEGEGGEDVE